MIRYTSDPVTNLDILYKTMASVSADPNIDTSNLNIPDNDVAPSTDNQIDVPYNTVLRLPDSDPYNQVIKGFDNTVASYSPKDSDIQVPMSNPEQTEDYNQMLELKSLEDKLNRLKEERAKYISQRQDKRDYYNSEGFLAKVYKYDPKTAEYLAGRKQADIDKTYKEQLLDNKIDVAAMRLNDNDVAKKDKLELQQLWKDNTRALESAKARGEEKTVIDTYQANVDRLVKQLKVIDPETWGEPDEGQVGGNNGEKSNLEQAKLDAKKLIDGGVDNTPKNGIIDDVGNIKIAIRDLKDKYNISTNDINGFLERLGDKEQAYKDEYNQYNDIKDREFSRSMQVKSQEQSTGAIDQRAATSKLKALNNNPNDIPARADAVLWIMRKNSGAMIGPTEILQYMQGKLPPERYDELVKDLSPTGMKAILGLVTKNLDEAQVSTLTAKYLPYLNIDSVKNDLNVWANKKIKNADKGTPKANNKGTTKIGKFTVKKRSN